jgi:hypothetical protein
MVVVDNKPILPSQLPPPDAPKSSHVSGLLPHFRTALNTGELSRQPNLLVYRVYYGLPTRWFGRRLVTTGDVGGSACVTFPHSPGKSHNKLESK